MKRTLSLLLLAIGVLSLPAFSQVHDTDWKALNAFHALVPKILHTGASGNLKPLKQNSAKLLVLAKDLQASTPPKDLDNPTIKKQVVDLVKQCQDLDAAVKAKKADAELRSLANKTHRTFHDLLADADVDDH